MALPSFPRRRESIFRHPELDSGSSQEVITEGDENSYWVPASAGMTTQEQL